MTVLIVAARFYNDIADELVKGAANELEDTGVEHEEITVPGAFEIPAAIAFAEKSGKYEGYIALGCVIRGETSHYDYVCSESARGLNDLAMRDGVALGYGILTVENRDQAWVRAKVDEGNKGKDAAMACIEMMKIKQKYVG